MRVISGIAKGLHIRTLDGLRTRPTSDRVREALFNILGQNLEGATFLDLFAGSGAVGIEALSRGAKCCVFVDDSVDACRIIRTNLITTGFRQSAEVHCKDVVSAIEIAGRKQRQFDYVFMDPPYERGLVKRVFMRLASSRILSDDVTVVIEHSKREMPPEDGGHLTMSRTETYGDTVLSFYGKPLVPATPKEAK